MGITCSSARCAITNRECLSSQCRADTNGRSPGHRAWAAAAAEAEAAEEEEEEEEEEEACTSSLRTPFMGLMTVREWWPYRSRSRKRRRSTVSSSRSPAIPQVLTGHHQCSRATTVSDKNLRSANSMHRYWRKNPAECPLERNGNGSTGRSCRRGTGDVCSALEVCRPV